MFLLEATWWAHRALWQLIFAGVLERHPTLQFVFTEQGTAWLPEQLATLDDYYDRMAARGRLAGARVGRGGDGRAVAQAERVLGPAVPRRVELHPPARGRRCATRSGVDRIMWGSDFPHREGCWPFSHEHLRLAFAECRPDEVPAMVGGNAARVYGFDLDALAPIAARVGPIVDEVAAAARRRRDPRRGAALPGLRRSPPRRGR